MPFSFVYFQEFENVLSGFNIIMFFECLFLDCYLGCVSMFGIVYMGNYKDEEQLISKR